MKKLIKIQSLPDIGYVRGDVILPDTTNVNFIDAKLDHSSYMSSRYIKSVVNKDITFDEYLYSQDAQLLREIADYCDVQPEEIVIANGSDAVLDLVSRVLLDEEVSVGIPVPTFFRFEHYARMNGAKLHFFKRSKFPYNIDMMDILEQVKQHDIDVVFIANPNNPTGIYIEPDKIDQFMRVFSGYLVVDEALGDYADISVASLIHKHKRLIVVKSFSKLFGLAGLRIGYGIACSGLIDALRKVVHPFSVATPSIIVAREVLKDRQYILTNVRRTILGSLKALWKLKLKNIKFTPSVSSVFLAKAYSEKKLHSILYECGLGTIDGDLIRGLEGENCVRISVQSPKLMTRISHILSEVDARL